MSDELIIVVRKLTDELAALKRAHKTARADGYREGFAAGRKDAEENYVGGMTHSRLARLLLRDPDARMQSHSTIAQRIGCSREGVTRMFLRWKKQRILSPANRILNKSALEELSANGYQLYKGDVAEHVKTEAEGGHDD